MSAGRPGDMALARELRHRGIRDPRVLQAIAELSRANFISEDLADESCGDYPLPIGYGQSISQPFVVAFMSEALKLRGDERVLEVGTGSGYQTAILARLAREVYSVEVIEGLSSSAAQHLRRYGFENVHLRVGDGYFGWPEDMPFDRIVLTAAPQEVPPPLLSQLAPRGILLAPVGSQEESQELLRVTKEPTGEFRTDRLLAVRFVPMQIHGGSA